MKDIDFEKYEIYANIFAGVLVILAIWKLADIVMFLLNHVTINVVIH